MQRTFKALTIIVLLIISGCSNSINENDEKPAETETINSHFTGTIKEINGDRAIVSAKVVEDNSEGDVFVDLSVNENETFQVYDKVKVGFDGVVMESTPAQINTLSVEIVDD
ncbi:hypothetical protein J2Z83_003062 [Virgibacillus natechei]|uniref:DUF3221 domain-containing protein n=1 Tax=Virgibacillus natechei TaxID=1216297 RepID=A0ABS4IKS0_9BACI|nr:DUF3221 domain-containing protein [Virgibacillus natechei]MBP1970926.1 hypothetical protein [Virgibacillus natechei]UZD13305.1 YobA family protein [Virgibacillus natechei]